MIFLIFSFFRDELNNVFCVVFGDDGVEHEIILSLEAGLYGLVPAFIDSREFGD